MTVLLQCNNTVYLEPLLVKEAMKIKRGGKTTSFSFSFCRLIKHRIRLFWAISKRLGGFFKITVASITKVPIMRIRCHDKHTNLSR